MQKVHKQAHTFCTFHSSYSVQFQRPLLMYLVTITAESLTTIKISATKPTVHRQPPSPQVQPIDTVDTYINQLPLPLQHAIGDYHFPPQSSEFTYMVLQGNVVMAWTNHRRNGSYLIIPCRGWCFLGGMVALDTMLSLRYPVAQENPLFSLDLYLDN
jgi:hypothetical protein